MQPMGGGIGSDDVTAAKAHVLAGHNTVTTDSDDEVVEGTMPDNAAWSALTPGSGSVTIPAGYHNGSGTVSGSASYSQGVSNADGRVNTSSASYKSGYTNGRGAAASSHSHSEYIKRTGDTMSGALNFANNTANAIGDDVYIGDFNKGGHLGILGKNNNTGITLIKAAGSWSTATSSASIDYDATNGCISFVFA